MSRKEQGCYYNAAVEIADLDLLRVLDTTQLVTLEIGRLIDRLIPRTSPA
jgi:hypothetical protein